jgi:hypothetical protein
MAGGKYYVHVIDNQGHKIVVSESTSRRWAFAEAEDILRAGLVMNGREVRVEGVRVGRHR